MSKMYLHRIVFNNGITATPGKKILRRFTGAALLLLGLLGAGNVDAQLLAWNFNTFNTPTGSVGSEASITATTIDPDVNTSTLTRGAGIAATGALLTFNANGWNSTSQANAATNNDYFQFTFNPKTGFKASLTTLDYKLRRSNTGPTTSRWYYSIDGGTIFLPLGIAATSYSGTLPAGATFTANLAGEINLQNIPNSTTVIFRLYAWPVGAGTFGLGRSSTSAVIDNGITLTGTTTVDLIGASSDVVAVAASESATIPSTQNAVAPLTSVTGAQAWAFTVRDGGVLNNDIDALPTIVNSITFAQAAGNQVSDWSQAIKTISLFDGATLVGTGTITATQIQFTGLTLTVPDNTNKTYTVRLSFNCGIGSANKDGEDIVFSLSNANFTTATSATSSQKTAFAAASSANGSNVISVVATQLIYNQQPSNVAVNASINPAVIVYATDACNNLDLNYTGTVTITSTGTLTSAQAESAVAGIATFPAVSFSAAATGITLTASAAGLTPIVSTTFDVNTTTALNPGDLMIVGFDTYTAGPAGEDKLSIANLVPLLPGTEFSIANMVYENTAAANTATGRWYNGNGNLAQSPPYITIKYNGLVNLAKGSVICITIAPTGAVTDISVNGSTSALFSVPVTSSFVQFASDKPDAFFLMQGTFSADDVVTEAPNVFKTFTGTVFGAIQIRGTFSAFSVAGNAGDPTTFRVSRIYPTLGCISVSMPGGTGSSVAYFGYYRSAANGGLHTGTQHELISAIGNVGANWVTGIAGLGNDDLATTTTCSNTFTVTSNVAYGYWVGSGASKDWYDCNNWDNLAVPDATINVTIDGTALNDCQLDANSSLKAAQFGNKGDAKSITINGRKLIIENTGAIVNRLDIAGSINIATANGLDMNDGIAATTDGTLNIKGNWTNNFANGFDEGESLVNFNSTTATQTITAPGGETFYNLTNSNSAAGGVVMANSTANVTVSNILLLSNGLLTVNTNTLTLNGTAAGSGTLTGSNTSNLIIGGTAGGALGTVSFTAGSRLLNNLTINRTGAGATATLGSDLGINTMATITAGILNAGTNTLNGAGGLTMTGGELQLGKTGVTIPEFAGAYSLTGGAVNFTGTASQTIKALNYYDLTSTSNNVRVMPNPGTVGIANAFTPGTSAFTFTGSTVDYNGSGNQNIAAFVSGVAAGSTYNNLTLSNDGIKTLSGNTDVEGVLTLNNDITLKFVDNFLSLKSTATTTARLAPVFTSPVIDYTGGSGTGCFIVERYIPAKRAWRLLTSPVTAASGQTISAAWREGATPRWPMQAEPVLSVYNPKPGYGTHISGGSSVNGYDQNVNGNASLKYFNAGAWVNLSVATSLYTQKVTDYPGYMLFVRGSRALDLTAGTAVVPDATVLRTSGKINLANLAPSSFTGTGVQVVSNPFPSAINFKNVSRTGATFGDIYYMWDPKLTGANGVGAFVTFNRVGAVYVQTLTSSGTPYGGTLPNDGTIESGAAFMVDYGISSGTLDIGENAKVTTSSSTPFGRPAPSPANSYSSFRTNLAAFNSDSTIYLLDGVLSVFNAGYNNGVDMDDAAKISTFSENLGIANAGKKIAIEKRKPLKANDTIFLYLSSLKVKKYQFELDAKDIAGNNLAGFVEDNYRLTSTPINMDGITRYDFSVENIPGSYAADRFRIVFKKSVRCNAINANVVRSDVAVDWIFQNETEMSYYDVERSENGSNFTSVGTVNAAEIKSIATDYHWLDINPEPGVYFYRIKGTSVYGATGYSEPVKVKVVRQKSQLYVYPNPVTDGAIGLQMNTMPAGVYNTRLLNAAGQPVLNKQIVHAKSTATELIAYPASLTAGTYQLEVTGPDKKRSFVSIVIVRK